MGSANIQAKIKAGLAKAVKATGSSDSEKVYLVMVSSGGTFLDPIRGNETLVELKNAIFKNYEKGLSDVSIQAGDRQLVSDNEVKIAPNDIIRQGGTDYIVVNVSESSPTSDVLNYISQVRVR